MKSTRRRWLVACAAVALSMVMVQSAAADWATGVQAYKNKDYATAVSAFEEVTQTNPDYAGAYYMLGLSQQALGKLSQALANLRKAVELEADNSSYKLALAQALVLAKQYQDAYTQLKAISAGGLQPAHRSTHALLLAQAATKTGRPAEAVSVLKPVTREDGKNARLYQSLGAAYDALGDDPQAFQAFKTAFSLNPQDEVSARNAISAGIAAARRASRSQKDRYYTEAGQIAERLATTDPSFDHQLLAGESWLGAKEYGKALQWFDKAQAKQPQNALVHFYRAQCLTSMDRLDPALAELQEALKTGAPSGKLRQQIYNQGGYIYDKQKRYDKAIQWYQEAGNTAMVREMRDKAEAAQQNLAAQQEQEEFRQKLRALELQIAELEKLGEVEQANQLRAQLEELKKALQ